MAYTIWYLLKSNIQTQVVGVVSESTEDVTNFDNSNYRDLAELPVDGIFDQDPTIGTTLEVLNVGAHTFYGTETVNTTLRSYTGDDMALHVAPRNESKKRTRYKWVDAAANVIAWAWADELVAVSPAQFNFVS